MTISVIIPTYNRQGTVGEAIESVLRQTAKAHEIIVVDDGSSDGTSGVLNLFARDIVLIRQDNAGVSAARNAGLSRATGSWVAFLDSDDVFLPNWLELIESQRAAARAGVHIADHMFEGPGYEKSLFEIRGFAFPPGTSTLVERPLQHVISGLSLNSMACRLDWMRAVGGFNPTIRMYEDLDVMAKLALRGPWLFTPQVVSRVRRMADPAGHALTAIAARNKIHSKGILVQIFAELSQNGALAGADARLAREALCAALFGQARAMQEAGQSWQSLTPLLLSARNHPSIPRGWGKAAILLLLGDRHYAKFASRQRGFYREDYER